MQQTMTHLASLADHGTPFSKNQAIITLAERLAGRSSMEMKIL